MTNTHVAAVVAKRQSEIASHIDSLDGLLADLRERTLDLEASKHKLLAESSGLEDWLKANQAG